MTSTYQTFGDSSVIGSGVFLLAPASLHSGRSARAIRTPVVQRRRRLLIRTCTRAISATRAPVSIAWCQTPAASPPRGVEPPQRRRSTSRLLRPAASAESAGRDRDLAVGDDERDRERRTGPASALIVDAAVTVANIRDQQTESRRGAPRDSSPAGRFRDEVAGGRPSRRPLRSNKDRNGGRRSTQRRRPPAGRRVLVARCSWVERRQLFGADAASLSVRTNAIRALSPAPRSTSIASPADGAPSSKSSV